MENKLFMRLVVNGIYMIMMKLMGYNMASHFHLWDELREDFLTTLNGEYDASQ